MSGYLNAMTWTGNAAVDSILDAVAEAGDRYHHTEQWNEDTYGEGSPISKIDAAAAKAAEAWAALTARAEAAERERDQARDVIQAIELVLGCTWPKEHNAIDAARHYAQALTEARAERDKAESERDQALATVASAPDRITTTGDNEITSHPWWGVVDPRRGCDGVVGPFFSRKSAEDHLAHKRHRYGKKARVFCFSGHESSDYRAIHRHVDGALKGPVTP